MTLPWPESGDRLFVPTGDIKSLALVHNDRKSVLATGYRSAGDAMVDWTLEHGITDFLVYPIVFCYRHYVELTLKRLHKIVTRADGSNRPELRGHHLRELWDTVVVDLNGRIDQYERDAFDAAAKLIVELDSVDRKSQSFRYGESIPFDRVDLNHLKRVMAKLATFLDALADYWSVDYS